MQWWHTLLLTIAAGLAVVALGAWVRGYLQEKGRNQASKTNERKDKERAAREEQLEAERLAAEKRAAEQAEADEIERLRHERIGVRFIRRTSRDDPGLHLTVVNLDPRAPRGRVLVVQEPPPHQVAGVNNPDPAERISYQWHYLTMPSAGQRHRTARLFERSHNDDDGWIEVERIT